MITNSTISEWNEWIFMGYTKIIMDKILTYDVKDTREQ